MFILFLSFLRFTGRSLAFGAILGFLAAVWHSSSGVFDSMRATHQAKTGEEFAEDAALSHRGSRHEVMAQRDQAATAAAFLEFRQKASEFWRERYHDALASAERRIEQEAEQALEVARTMNTAARLSSARVARETNARHYTEAIRVAKEAAAENAKVATRIARHREAGAGIAARMAAE